jgi:hypothetical protein
MKLLDVIRDLTEVWNQHGNIDVLVSDEGGRCSERMSVTANKYRQEDHEETCFINTDL